VQTKDISSTKTCEILPYFLQSFFGPFCVEKVHTSAFICCLHPGKEAFPINKSRKEDTGRKNKRRFVFGKPVLLISVLDLLRLTLWVFWPEIFTRLSSLCLMTFGWDLSPKFVPQDLEYIFSSSLLGLKGRFVCVWKCLIFFFQANTHSFGLKLVAFRSKFSRDSYVKF